MAVREGATVARCLEREEKSESLETEVLSITVTRPGILV